MRKFARDSDIIGGEGKSPQGLGVKDWTKVRCRAIPINPHPGGLQMIGMFFGTALVSGDLHAFLGAGVITVANARKIRLEERNLSQVFGAAYDEYRRTTRALIPWVL